MLPSEGPNIVATAADGTTTVATTDTFNTLIEAFSHL
jgi:hypothetical protein